MADQMLTLELDDELHARMTAAAAEKGLSVEAWARRQLEVAVDVSGLREEAGAFDAGADWTEADRRLAEYDRTGDYVDAEAWLTELEAEVRARRPG